MTNTVKHFELQLRMSVGVPQAGVPSGRLDLHGPLAFARWVVAEHAGDMPLGSFEIVESAAKAEVRPQAR